MDDMEEKAMKRKVLICATIITMLSASAAYAKSDHGQEGRKGEDKKTGLRNALERGNKNDTAREAIRRALERQLNRWSDRDWDWDWKWERDWDWELSHERRVAYDLERLEIRYSGTDRATSVTQPITLPATGAKGSAITWVSSNPAVVSHDGLTVKRPAAGAGDATVTMTAKVVSGDAAATKTFQLTVKQQADDAGKVAADKAALAITYAAADSAASVTRPLTLPTTGANGSSITWMSGNPAVISNDGLTVNRPAIGSGDVNVVLTAIIKYGNVSDVKTFTVTVKPMWSDMQRVAADKAALSIKFGGTDTADSVTKPMTLPTVGVYGSTVTWISGNPAVVSNDGQTIHRPAAGSGDVTVNMTAIINYNGYADSRTFAIVVKQQLTDAQKVAADKAVLTPIYLGTDTAASVTQSLTLPEVGANGSSIIWVSGNLNVISDTGVVYRPAAGTSDISVQLTAVIVSGGVADTKTFTVIVKRRS